MQVFNEAMMKNLAFPDVAVEKMVFVPEKKSLKIYVDGAILDIDQAARLGPGVLFFDEWENLEIKKFDSDTEKWSAVDTTAAESLNDLCEVKFLDSQTSLAGFSKESGQWIEWNIAKAKMRAEFE